MSREIFYIQKACLVFLALAKEDRVKEFAPRAKAQAVWLINKALWWYKQPARHAQDQVVRLQTCAELVKDKVHKNRKHQLKSEFLRV